MTRRGVARPRHIALGDNRSPMRRFLEDAYCVPRGATVGAYEVQYNEQWRTLFKAQRLGYIDDSTRPQITEAGTAFLASNAK